MKQEHVSIPIVKRNLKILCHKMFDNIWLSGLMSRDDSYTWLAIKLEIDKNDCHFSKMKRGRMIKSLKIIIEYLNSRYKDHNSPHYTIF